GSARRRNVPPRAPPAEAPPRRSQICTGGRAHVHPDKVGGAKMQRIVNPAARAEQRMVPLAPRDGRPGSRPIVLFSNNKPNVDLLFDALTERLRAANYDVRRAAKANSAFGAPSDLVSTLSQDAGWIVNGVGD